MTSPHSARQYPVACPHCGGITGFPYQVKTVTDRPGSIEVKLRCRACSHEWGEVIVNND